MVSNSYPCGEGVSPPPVYFEEVLSLFLGVVEDGFLSCFGKSLLLKLEHAFPKANENRWTEMKRGSTCERTLS